MCQLAVCADTRENGIMNSLFSSIFDSIIKLKSKPTQREKWTIFSWGPKTKAWLCFNALAIGLKTRCTAAAGRLYLKYEFWYKKYDHFVVL